MIAPPPEAKNASPGTDGDRDDFGRLLERTVQRCFDAWADLSALRSVAFDRFQLRLVKILAAAVAALTVWIVIVVAAIAGVLVLALGLRRTLADVFVGHPGVGEIAAGLVLLLLPLGVWLLARALLERATFRRLEAKYARIESKRTACSGKEAHAEA